MEAAGHLHEVARRVQAGAGFKIRLERPFVGLGAPAEEPPRRLGFAGEVNFRAVAGGQEHRALHPRLLLEPLQHCMHALPGKGQLFPEGEGRAVAVQAGHHKAHFPSSLAMTKEKYPEGSVRSSKCS